MNELKILSMMKNDGTTVKIKKWRLSILNVGMMKNDGTPVKVFVGMKNRGYLFLNMGFFFLVFFWPNCSERGHFCFF